MVPLVFPPHPAPFHVCRSYSYLVPVDPSSKGKVSSSAANPATPITASLKATRNKKVHQLMGQCETRRHSSHSGCRIKYLLSLAPKTFMHYRDNNTTPAIIMRLEYNHSNKKTTTAGRMRSPLEMRPAICVTRGRRLAYLSPIFGVKEQNCLIGYIRTNAALQSQFRKL